MLDVMGGANVSKHGQEPSPSRHIHETSASTADSFDGKDSMTSVESGKRFENQPPSPPPKDEFKQPITYQQPPTSAHTGPQPTPENQSTAPNPSPFPDQIVPQPLAAMPAQAYQFYKPKPYQPKSKPSVKRQPNNQQLPGQGQDASDQGESSHPQPQNQTQAQSQPQPLIQSQVPVQFPAQIQPQSQAPFQGQVSAPSQSPVTPQSHQYYQQQQQQQQPPLQQQQPLPHLPIQTGPEVQSVSSAGGPPSTTSSSNEATPKSGGKSWMNAIRSSLLPKEKKDSKDNKDGKDGRNTQITSQENIMSPQQQYGPSQGQFGAPPSQYGPPQSQHSQGQIQTSTPYNVGHPMNPVSGAPNSAVAIGASLHDPRESLQGNPSAPLPISQNQQQQYQQQIYLQQQQQPAQQQIQRQSVQQPTYQEQPVNAQVSGQHVPVQQQHGQLPAPSVEIHQAGPVVAQDKDIRSPSNASISSFNGAGPRHEGLDAASAASAAIDAARHSSSSLSTATHNARMDGPVAGPYQTLTQPQQPMVQIPEQQQQPPGSPVSDAGSRVSVSEVRSIQVIARAQAMYDFAGEDEGDLPFKVGDTINVIEFLNDDWWRGILRKDVGIFPTAYVQQLKPPPNGQFPTISVSVRQSIVGLPAGDNLNEQQQQGSASQSSQLQAQPSFRANYEPSIGAIANTQAGNANSSPSTVTPPPNASFQPMAIALANNNAGERAPTSDGTSSSFPAPPPPPISTPAATSVYTYFPGSGNQPPISPPPSLRNQNQRFSSSQGHVQGSPVSTFPPNQGLPGGPFSPSQQQPFQGQYQQQGQFQQQQNPGYGAQGSFQQPSGQSNPDPSIGSNSQMTTQQMAAAVKSKKKFGTRW
ncbi:hypothetical protein BGX27_000392 [Mortierella sp. AM989]|nr:hypothetical protein BGX27_000392 [Mortierella sp. AM989]